MPVVLRYDDPALVATLGSQASRYATNRDQMQQSLEAQQLAQQGLNTRMAAADQHSQQLNDQVQGYAGGQVGGGYTEQLAPQASTPAMIDTNGALVGGQGGGPGATIYHPAGESPPMGGGRGGSSAVLAGGGYLNPQQQQLMGYVQQMEQQGALRPEEAIRYRAQIVGGKNPFEDQTVNEQLALRAASHTTDNQLTPYEQARLDMDNKRMTVSQQQAETRGKAKILHDQISNLQKRLASPMLLGDDAGQKALQGQLDDLNQQMLDLVSGGSDTSSAPAPAAAAGGSAAGSTSITNVPPVGQADVLYLVKKYGSAAKARAAAQRGERAPVVTAANPTTQPTG
jgi:hypothetical protein